MGLKLLGPAVEAPGRQSASAAEPKVRSGGWQDTPAAGTPLHGTWLVRYIHKRAILARSPLHRTPSLPLYATRAAIEAGVDRGLLGRPGKSLPQGAPVGHGLPDHWWD